MVHIPRDEQLGDPPASLPPDRRNRLRAGETRLIEYLNRQAEDASRASPNDDG